MEQALEPPVQGDVDEYHVLIMADIAYGWHAVAMNPLLCLCSGRARMNCKPMKSGKMHQSSHFIIDDLDGRAVEWLKLCVNPETDNVIIACLKAEGIPYHEFFLDAGAGFAQCHGESEWDEDDGDFLFIDLSDRWEAKGKRIEKIECQAFEAGSSRIVFTLQGGERWILRPLNAENPDEKTLFLRERP